MLGQRHTGWGGALRAQAYLLTHSGAPPRVFILPGDFGDVANRKYNKKNTFLTERVFLSSNGSRNGSPIFFLGGLGEAGV